MKKMIRLLAVTAALFVCGTFSVAAGTEEIKGGSENGTVSFSYEAATADSAAHRVIVYSGTVSMARDEAAVYEEEVRAESYPSVEEEAERYTGGEAVSVNDEEQEEVPAYTADEEEEPSIDEDEYVYTDPGYLPYDGDEADEISEDAGDGSDEEPEEEEDAPEEGDEIGAREIAGESDGAPAAENNDYIIDEDLNEDFLDEEDPLYVDDFFYYEEEWLLGDNDSDESDIYDEQEVDDSFGDNMELADAEFEDESESPDADEMESNGSRAD